jgi:hypothetical protein
MWRAATQLRFLKRFSLPVYSFFSSFFAPDACDALTLAVLTETSVLIEDK